MYIFNIKKEKIEYIEFKYFEGRESVFFIELYLVIFI